MIGTSGAAQPTGRGARLRRSRILLLLLFTLSLGLMAASGSALAAPIPTSITAHALSNTVTWGGGTVVTGTLMETATSTALGGQWVRVERSPSGSPSSWTLIAIVTTEDAQYATGQYTYSIHPTALTYYRFAFQATADYAATVSNTLLIRVRPALGRPVAPLSVKAGTRFTVSGSLKPHFAAGAKTVKIKVYRYRNGSWIVVKKLAATNVNSGSYSKYVLKMRLYTKAKYRFRAYTVATDTWAAASTSLSRTLVVK